MYGSKILAAVGEFQDSGIYHMKYLNTQHLYADKNRLLLQLLLQVVHDGNRLNHLLLCAVLWMRRIS